MSSWSSDGVKPSEEAVLINFDQVDLKGSIEWFTEGLKECELTVQSRERILVASTVLFANTGS